MTVCSKNDKQLDIGIDRQNEILSKFPCIHVHSNEDEIHNYERYLNKATICFVPGPIERRSSCTNLYEGVSSEETTGRVLRRSLQKRELLICAIIMCLVVFRTCEVLSS